MKQIAGWWLPDSEKHLGHSLAMSEPVNGRGTYQIQTLIEALNVRGRDKLRRAVDVGAHVGLWTYFLAKAFEKVEAFEPVEEFRRCFVRNCRGLNVTLHEEALGEAHGSANLKYDPSNTGATKLEAGGAIWGGVTVRPLGAFGFDDVDFIKIDTEGFETFVIEGARETLLRCKPVMVVEQKGGHKDYGVEGEFPAIDLLQSMGATVKKRVRDDFILAWE